MTLEPTLLERAGNACELCAATDALTTYEVGPEDSNGDGATNASAVLCETCVIQIEGRPQSDHWQCLSTSMWSQVPAVQILAWRMLKRLSGESWAQDLLDMMYLDESLVVWAEAGLSVENDDISRTPTRDSNGTELAEGDTITLIKDLQVKGAGFTAKRGTVVRNIHLTDNPEHIEGRVSGQQIVLVSAFLKKVI
jgi:protein PhnA